MLNTLSQNNMTNNDTLKKIILRMVKEEYPMITDAKVVSYDNEGKYYYNIFLGINPDIVNDMDNNKTTKIKKN